MSILTNASAAQYVRDYFAKCGETALINRVRPSADEGAIDVFFRLAWQGENSFTVWVCDCSEHGGTPHLYGEW